MDEAVLRLTVAFLSGVRLVNALRRNEPLLAGRLLAFDLFCCLRLSMSPYTRHVVTEISALAELSAYCISPK
jgi:hypothetical protein